MELIIPFLHYSKLYRLATSENVRRLIYDQWSKDTTNITRDLSSTKAVSSSTNCVFCHEKFNQDKDRYFCDFCFFPRTGVDEEFATYCLLSVCYYETAGEIVDDNNGTESSSQRVVYRQRLKMTWYNYERIGKMYEVLYPQCYQCKSLTRNLGAKFYYFDDRMFCDNCMFPLFIIILHNK
uniref:Ac52 n=1 Tax=Spodoptera frugiperda nuclear polyhedrosis virus TaxID=10455 RepID=A0A0R5RHU3_NPVSF|nr:hypothetical protein [Spodoptera frugiperda multiple nucleopolyhedrovirus]